MNVTCKLANVVQLAAYPRQCFVIDVGEFMHIAAAYDWCVYRTPDPLKMFGNV